MNNQQKNKEIWKNPLILAFFLPILLILVLCAAILSLASEDTWTKLNFLNIDAFNENEQKQQATSGKFIAASVINQDQEEIECNLELALTPTQQRQGLMYKIEMEANTGMLFVFQESEFRIFWMKNTYIPLDIAFLDTNMRIIDIYDHTKPENTKLIYKSTGRSMYVIEMNAGWFEKHNIESGAMFNFSL